MKRKATHAKREKRPTTPLGAKVRELREWSGFSQPILAQMVGCSVRSIWQIETGRRKPSRQMVARLADALDCESADLHGLIYAYERRHACGSNCEHHGEMRRGGGPDMVRENCALYTDCLTTLLKHEWGALSAHCQPNCVGFVETPRYIRAQRDGVRREQTSAWDSSDLGDSERPTPPPRRETGPEPVRLQLAPIRKGFFDYDRCTCTKCTTARAGKGA